MSVGLGHIPVSAVLLLPALLLAGCATARPASPSTAAPPEDVDPQAEAIAAQAARDVEQMRQLQTQRDTAESTPPRPPEIQWIVPAPVRNGLRSTPAQSALGTDGMLPEAPPLTPAAAESPMPDPGGAIDPVPGALDAPAGGERMSQLVVDLCAELFQEAAHSDMPLRELLVMAAVMGLETPQRPFVPEALPGLTDRERELLSRMHAHFVELGKELERSGDPEAVVRAVETLHQALVRQPQLTVPDAALCTRVGGFGDYDEFARNEAQHYTFLAGTGQQAVVYVEIEDFASEPNDKGLWVTELAQQLVIYSDRDGIPVWREDWQVGVDASKNRRDDFFLTQIVTLPARLSVGRYQLKIQIRDEQSGAEAETALDFEMVADPRMTGG